MFDIGKEYQDIYADLYKLKSGFSGWLCEKKIEKCDYWAVNRPETGVILRDNWY